MLAEHMSGLVFCPQYRAVVQASITTYLSLAMHLLSDIVFSRYLASGSLVVALRYFSEQQALMPELRVAISMKSFIRSRYLGARDDRLAPEQ